MSQVFTYQDVAEHNTKHDIYLVINGKVYDCAEFIDEHPGGEEVMLDCAGQDATEAFEDVGHSDEARESLSKLLVGTLKRQAGDPTPKIAVASLSAASSSDSTGFGIGIYAFVVLGGIIAYFGYLRLQAQSEPQAA